MSKPKRFLSLLMVMTMVVTSISVGLGTVKTNAATLTPFSASAFRRPSPSITLDVTDVTRVGASADTMGSGTTIKKATPSGVPYITGTYATQAYDGETPQWPTIAFSSSVAVTITSVTITGGTAAATLTAGSLTNTTAATWEIRGGTATAGSTLKVAITYTYTWNNPYTGVSVTDTYVTNGYSYVENIIFPSGVWAFASAYSSSSNAADVQYVSRLLGRGVYGQTIGREANSANEYSSGYFDFSSNSHTDDGDTTIPKKTMLIADPAHEGAYNQEISTGTGSYASGDSDRAKAIVYLDSSIQTLRSNNFRMNFFIHGNSRSTNSAKDLTFETINVRDGDVAYTGGTGDALGASSVAAKAALNPTGPVDGTTETGGLLTTMGATTESTLYGSGAAGSYTLVTQWTGRGDNPSTGTPNWMHYYHAVTIEIVRIDKGTLRSSMNTAIGTATKTVTGSNYVTTIDTAKGSDPVNGGIANDNKGKNPQSWYYSTTWNMFSNYYDAAWTAMNKPNASQTLVNTAVNYLNATYASLTLAGANYSNNTTPSVTTGQGNTYYGSTVSPLNTIVTAIENADTSFNSKLRSWKTGQYLNYTDESRTALEEVYQAAKDCQAADYNVLYQPYVDYCAQQLQAAVNNLAFKPNTVTFDANGGAGTMSTQSMDAGSSAGLIANTYTKTGYIFAGWATTNIGAVAYADGANFTMGTNNVTLFAKWTPITYTVIYNGNGNTGGTTVNSTHTYDTAKELNINGYTRLGYTFIGWGLSLSDTVPTYTTDNNSALNLSSQQGEKVNLYAVWQANDYSVIFNANGGGGTMSSQNITYLQSATLKLINFSLVGYSFKGWSTTQANANAGVTAYNDGSIFNMSTPESKMIYASWTPRTFSINFNANATGVTGTMSPQDLLFGQTSNLRLNSFLRDGYQFAGWASSEGGLKAFNNGASFTMNTEGAILYAKWDANVYSVVYNANGGSGAPAPNSATYGIAFTIPSAEPVRTGYTFLGWSLDFGAEKPDYSTGKDVMNLSTSNGSTVTLYAVWQPNNTTSYKVEHYQESLTGTYSLFETTTQTGITGELGVAEYKTYPGFDKNTTHPSTISSGIIIGNGSLILRIYYVRINCTIIFETNGGSDISSISGKYGSAITPPVNPTKLGYTFTGWNPILPSTIPSSNITVTAQWSSNPYNVVFNGNGATSGAMPAQTITFGTSATLSRNTYIKKGYAFSGWSTTQGGSKEYNDEASLTMLATGMTLYAVWVPATDTEYEVEHYLQNIDDNSYTVGKTTVQKGTTNETGYAEWQTIPGFTSDPTNSNNVISGVVKDDGTLLLKLYYTRNSYTLSFSDAAGTNPIIAKYEASIAAPATPAKVGYSFYGWYKDVQITQPVAWPYSMGALNTTFYPKWVANTYTVIFDSNGGKIDGSTGSKYSFVNYDNTYGAGTYGFPVPVKTGYTFNGWFTADNVRINADTVVKINSTQTLTASWTLNNYTVSFDLNGGIGTPPQSVIGIYGTAVLLPTSGYSDAKTGYTFLGWNTSQIASTALQSFSIPEGNVTLYAVWKAKQFTVSYDLNGGVGVTPSSITADFGSSIDVSLSGFTKTGYTFAGWATTPNGTLADKLTAYTVQEHDTTLYAIWIGVSHTITLIPNGGAGPEVQQIQSVTGATVDLSVYKDVYSKDGFTFIGWNTSQSVTTGFWSYTVPSSESTTVLFAVYVITVNATVSFNLHGGTGTVPESQTAQEGTDLTLPAQGNIARAGYNFLGWATSPTASQALAHYTVPNTDITLFAVWSKIPALKAKEGSTIEFQPSGSIIYGLEQGMTADTFTSKYIAIDGNGELRFTPGSNGFGTGTKVELIDKATNEVTATFYIVIFGDIDGDGYITAEDNNIVNMVATYQTALEKGSAFMYAADLTQDGIVDAFDLNILNAAIHLGTIDQTNPGNIIHE